MLHLGPTRNLTAWLQKVILKEKVWFVQSFVTQMFSRACPVPLQKTKPDPIHNCCRIKGVLFGNPVFEDRDASPLHILSHWLRKVTLFSAFSLFRIKIHLRYSNIVSSISLTESYIGSYKKSKFFFKFFSLNLANLKETMSLYLDMFDFR